MSIHAKIAEVESDGNGMLDLILAGVGRDDPGQSRLKVVNPPECGPCVFACAVIDTEIWGDSSYIMIGEKQWARRIGYTKIELLPVMQVRR